MHSLPAGDTMLTIWTRSMKGSRAARVAGLGSSFRRTETVVWWCGSRQMVEVDVKSGLARRQIHGRSASWHMLHRAVDDGFA